MMKRNDGFTMVELLVTIAAAAVVTIAAASLILLGVRIQHASTADAAEQQNVRIVLTMLEKMAGNGEISKVDNTFEGWTLKDKNEQVLVAYDADAQTLYSGADSSAVLLEKLNGASARMDGKLLRFTFNAVRGGSYETAIYCRTNILTDVETPVVDDTATGGRAAFLTLLITEYNNGSNVGQIVKDGLGTYYSEWYVGDYQDNPGWNEKTPWCACFLSWAAVESGAVEITETEGPNTVPRDYGSPYVFANVDEGIKAFDLDNSPAAGDYVFFDWSGEKKDPAHVGVVLNVDTANNIIYTIEGNSGGVIAVRKYTINSSVIIGYGTLPAFVQSESDAEN